MNSRSIVRIGLLAVLLAVVFWSFASAQSLRVPSGFDITHAYNLVQSGDTLRSTTIRFVRPSNCLQHSKPRSLLQYLLLFRNILPVDERIGVKTFVRSIVNATGFFVWVQRLVFFAYIAEKYRRSQQPEVRRATRCARH